MTLTSKENAFLLGYSLEKSEEESSKTAWRKRLSQPYIEVNDRKPQTKREAATLLSEDDYKLEPYVEARMCLVR
ncbi:hypothetical protein RHMOL_Rhmol12G0048500 [Rhododendron molle]|uniref:Uncharacterized protein n=1 Tax=Rhododendron molle TaxID=49168 RepID=A0ACC0LEX2_RHOML|nr:hypothetical protein RHMOL_Rhmol12G0048500 [Rhododendron molle]